MSIPNLKASPSSSSRLYPCCVGKRCCRMTTEMTLNQAQEEFASILARLSPAIIPKFVGWIGDGFGASLNKSVTIYDEAEEKLRSIRRTIRVMVPLESCFKPTKILHNGKENGKIKHEESISIKVDNFLYDDDDVNQLIKEGDIQQHYCNSCGSKDIKSIAFVSHSNNLIQLRYVFTYLLPKLGINLDGKIFVDITARLGGFVYAAVLYCPNIADAFGIEVDKEKYSIQTVIAETHKTWNKLNFINDDFRNQKKLLAKADFVVINCLSDIYPTEKEQEKCWQKLKECLKSQAIILHTSVLRKEIKNLDLGWEIEEWVEQLDTRQIGNDYLLDSHLAIGCYGSFEVFRVR